MLDYILRTGFLFFKGSFEENAFEGRYRAGLRVVEVSSIFEPLLQNPLQICLSIRTYSCCLIVPLRATAFLLPQTSALFGLIPAKAFLHGLFAASAYMLVLVRIANFRCTYTA